MPWSNRDENTPGMGSGGKLEKQKSEHRQLFKGFAIKERNGFRVTKGGGIRDVRTEVNPPWMYYLGERKREKTLKKTV